MSDKPEEPLKKAAKEWAKSYWLITPWNLLGFGCSLELTKLLFGLVGTSGYATVSGNFKLSGIMLLSLVAAAVFVEIGKWLFRVTEKEQTKTFWLIGFWIILAFPGCLLFFARAVLILLGIMSPSAEPPGYIQWLFDPGAIDWLLGSSASIARLSVWAS